MKYRVTMLILLSITLGVWPNQMLATSIEDQEAFEDRVNLALRQVGHKLLNLEGNETSTIPPVEVIHIYQYKLSMQDSFNYDTLPFLIDQAFTSFNIKERYRVSVERCEDALLILGYNDKAFLEGDVACRGREQVSDCNNIYVTFDKPIEAALAVEESNTMKVVFPGLLALLALTVFGYFLWRKNKSEENHKDSAQKELSELDLTQITLGKFVFDHQNQTLQLGDEKQNLTFRESKLLHYLVLHKNEVQTRDTLIENVWADEGVLVGRSLDVFISRLRKLLKADENVAIKNIHGVGYRLELAG